MPPTADYPPDHNWPILEPNRIRISNRDAIPDIPDDIAYPHTQRRSVGSDIIRQAKAAGITAGQQLARIMRHSDSYADAGDKFDCTGKAMEYYLEKFGVSQQRVVLRPGDYVVIRRTNLPATSTEV